MKPLTSLHPYADERGNRIIYDGPALPTAVVKVTFKGENNVLLVHSGAKIVDLTAVFAGDGGRVEIGATVIPRTGLRFRMRLGHQSAVTVGESVGAESPVFIGVAEGQSVTIGDDCMFSTSVELRADDSHAIYDVRTGKRVNQTRSISIGDHVWIGRHVAVLGGGAVGDGSVIGFRSIVTKQIPNNCVAAGAPARVVRKHVAWERPLLSTRLPGIEGVPDGQVTNAEWWNLTVEDATPDLHIQRRPRRGWFSRSQAGTESKVGR